MNDNDLSSEKCQAKSTEEMAQCILSLQESLSSFSPSIRTPRLTYPSKQIIAKQPRGTSRTFYIRYDILAALDVIVQYDGQGRRAGEIISLLLYELMAYDSNWREIVLSERKRIQQEL